MGLSRGNLELILIAVFVACSHAETIGVVNGKMGDNLPSEEEVVTLLKTNNIGKYRIYQEEPTVFKAFENSGIEITVGISNDNLESISSSQDAANKWVHDYILPYPATNFKYITVGNQALGTAEYKPFVLRAMTYIQTALQNAKLDKNIMVSTTHSDAVFADKTSPPSKTTFRGEIKDSMTSLLQFLQEHASAFMVNIYPHKSVMAGTSSLDYALFESTSPVMTDGNVEYMNLLDSKVDSFYGAVEGLGYSTVPIVITESGWPSKGNDVATIANATTYHNNLIRHVLSNAGTPRRPGTAIETYIFSLFNEDKKAEDETERNYGLFYPTKKPVYTVNLSPEFNYSFPADFIPRVTLLLYVDV